MTIKTTFGERLDKQAPLVFILPSVIIILFFSIFPLIVSLFIALSRLKFVKGGVELKFIGFLNFKKLILGVNNIIYLEHLTSLLQSATSFLVCSL